MPSWSTYFLASALLVAPALALPAKSSSTSCASAPTSTTEPCGQIAALQAKLWAEKGPSASLTAPVALATNCLYSVPIDRKVALAHIEGVKKYVQFQSTLSYLKNPPSADNFQAPISIDPLGNLTALSHDIQAQVVTKEYDFELRLRNIIASANDGHFSGSMGGLRSIGFTTPFSLASVSEDGIALPEVYQVDVNAGIMEPVGSAVKNINGKDVTEFLSELAFGTGLQNPNARFNTLFPTHGIAGALVDDSFWRTRRRYPGQDSFTMTFANGTSYTGEYSAIIYGNWTNVTDSASFYKEFVYNGQIINAPAAANCSSDSKNAHGMSLRKAVKVNEMSSAPMIHKRSGEITPEVTDEGGIFGGYFIKGNDGKETAVMQLLAFEPACGNQLPDTIASIAKFLALCRKKGVERAVIDLTNNPGGYIVLGYDFFLQLFPDADSYSGQRMRETPGSILMANAFAKINDTVLMQNITDAKLSNALENAPTSDWLYQADLDENNKPFPNVKALLGPVETNGDKFSAIWRFNVTDQVSGLGLTDPSLVPGLTAPFKAENIVMMTDGQCSSTCSTFSEFMQTQKNVRSVAVGGLPTAGRGMAMVGGVRGSEVLDYGSILAMSDAVNVVSPTKDAKILADRKSKLPQKLPLPMIGTVNYLDNIRKGQDTPLQFIEEMADCRIFYSKETIGRSEKLWGQVASIAFEGAQGCVVGHL